MLLSMTGFSNVNFEVVLKSGKKVAFAIELKSINSRFFELVTRLPSSINFLENEISIMLKEKLLRGRVYLTVTPVLGDFELEVIVPQIQYAKTYITASKKLQKEFKLSGELTIADLIKLPNVFAFEKADLGTDLKGKLLAAIASSADKLTKMRAVEGENLWKDIKNRLLICKKAVEKISKLNEKYLKDQKELVSKTVVMSQQGDEGAKNQLDEMYAALNKMDITEETIRFKSHIDSLDKFLKGKDIEKGKRFDFVLQELMREINTISAKSSKFELNSLAVDIKVEIEKAREQVQNIL